MRAPGLAAATTCFSRPGESVLLLSQSGAVPPVLVMCSEEPLRDGSPCCTELDGGAWPWPVAGFTVMARERLLIRTTFVGCLDWDWERRGGFARRATVD